MPICTLTSKYQATIPRTVRDALGLGVGDRIEFLLDTDGDVRVRKVRPTDAKIRVLETFVAPEWDSPQDEAAFSRL